MEEKSQKSITSLRYKNKGKWEIAMFFKKVRYSKVWKTFFKSTQKAFKTGRLTKSCWIILLKHTHVLETSESRNLFLISNTQVSSCLYICSLCQSPNSIPKPFVLLKCQLSSPYWKGSSGSVSCAHDKQLGSMEETLTIDWKRVWTWSFTICYWRGYKKCKPKKQN